MSKQNNKVAKKSSASREDLVKAAQDSYSSASKSGGSNYASVTSYLASSTAAAKDLTFDTWSDSELKSYLDSYGVKNYQGSTTNELRGTYNVRVSGRRPLIFEPEPEPIQAFSLLFNLRISESSEEAILT